MMLKIVTTTVPTTATGSTLTPVAPPSSNLDARSPITPGRSCKESM